MNSLTKLPSPHTNETLQGRVIYPEVNWDGQGTEAKKKIISFKKFQSWKTVKWVKKKENCHPNKGLRF